MSNITINLFQKDLKDHFASYDEEGMISQNSMIYGRMQNIRKCYHDFNLECEIIRRILQKGIDKLLKTKTKYVSEIGEEDENFVNLVISDVEKPKESKSPINISKLSIGYSDNERSQKSVFGYNSDITDFDVFKLTSNYLKITELYNYISKDTIPLAELQKRSEQLELSEKIIHTLQDNECDLISQYSKHNYHAQRITSFKKLQIEYNKLQEQYNNNLNNINEENEESEDILIYSEVTMKMKEEKKRINNISIQNMVDIIHSSAKLRSKLLKVDNAEVCSRILLLIQNYFVLLRDDNEELPEPTLLIESCQKIYDAVFEINETYKISQYKTSLNTLRLMYPTDILLDENVKQGKIIFEEFVNDMKNMRKEMSKADVSYQKEYSKHFQSYFFIFEKAVLCSSKALTNDLNNYSKLESSLDKIILLQKIYVKNLTNISQLNDTNLNNHTCIILLKKLIDKCDTYYNKEVEKSKPIDIEEEKENNNDTIGIQYFYKFIKKDDEYKVQKYFLRCLKTIYNIEIIFIQFREIMKILVEEGFNIEFHSSIHKILSKMKEIKPYGKYNNYNSLSQSIVEEASSRIIQIIEINKTIRTKMEENHTQLTSSLNEIRNMIIRIKNYVVEEDLFYYEMYIRVEYLSRLLIRHIEICDRRIAKSRKIEEILQQMYELWWTDSDSRIIYRVITTEIPQIEALTYSRPSSSELYLNPNPNVKKYIFGKGIKIAPEPSSDLSLLITGPPLPTPFGYEVLLELILWSIESYQYYYPNIRLDLYKDEINELLHTNIQVNNKKIMMYDTQICIYEKYILLHMNDIDLLIDTIIEKELLLKENNKYICEVDKNEMLYHENTIQYDLCGIDCLKLFEEIENNLYLLKKEYKEFIKSSTYHFNKMRRLHNLLLILIKERVKEIKDINENNEMLYKEIYEEEDKIENRMKSIHEYRKMNEEKYMELMKYFKEERKVIENILNEGKKKIKMSGICMNTTPKNEMIVLLEKWITKQDIQENNSKLPFKDMQ